MKTEKNKIIAEFMGLKIITDGISFFDTDYNRLKNYHSDWSQIMEVVEKIENIGATVIIGRMFCDIKYTNPLDQSKHFEIRIVSGVKINTTNGAVIEFIKWYNEQKA